MSNVSEWVQVKEGNIETSRLAPVVAVPARNEEKRLPMLLAGLAAQSWLSDSVRPLDVVIVLNNCTDRSREAVLDSVARHSGLAVRLLDVVFAEPHAHVGSARRLAMEKAFESFAAPERAAILTTDADAVPSPDWVAANLDHLSKGADLVGGLIVGNLAEEERLGPDFRRRAELHKRYGQAIDRLAFLIDPQPHDPWPHHHDHTGASIAVRADVYRAVGGLPPLPFREDVAFVGRVRSAGFLVGHPLDVVVEVSARLAGRAPGGMSDCLKIWMRAAANGEALFVEDPARVLDRLQMRRCRRTRGATAVAAGLATDLFADDLDAPQTIPVESAIEIVEGMIEQAEQDVRAA